MSPCLETGLCGKYHLGPSTVMHSHQMFALCGLYTFSFCDWAAIVAGMLVGGCHFWEMLFPAKAA